MLCNLGIVDRLIRVTTGGALISMVYYGPQTQWGWLGIMPLLSGVLCFCPVYGVMGVKTCKKTINKPK